MDTGADVATTAGLDAGTGDGAVDEAAPLGFTCPRCSAEVSEAYYGPCTSCRTTLRLTVGAAAQDVSTAAYEPKMNVTPNAVATKD